MIDQTSKDYFDELEALSTQCYNADYNDFSEYLARWLFAVDRAPEPIDAEISELFSLTTWDAVKSKSIQFQSGMGGGRMSWPLEKTERLGAQLHLFRKLASGELDSADFAFHMYHASHSTLTDDTQELVARLFVPHSEELIRYLKMKIDGRVIPASDRVVTLNHNALELKEAIDSIEAIADDLEGNNALAADERQRLQAEIRAGGIILRAKQLRVETLKRLLIPPLTHLARTLRDTALGKAAEALLRLLGVLISTLFGLGG